MPDFIGRFFVHGVLREECDLCGIGGIYYLKVNLPSFYCVFGVNLQ